MAVKVKTPKKTKKPSKLGDFADVKKGKGTKSQKKKVGSTLWKRYEAKYPARALTTDKKRLKRKPKKLKQPNLEKWFHSSGKKVAKKAAKKAHKTIAGKLVGKLGAPGKAIAGAALLIDYAKMKQKGKKGCPAGTRKVTKGGKTYCQGQRKGRDY